jgi:hypothetical protein
MPRPRKTQPRKKHQVNVSVNVRDITRAGTSLEIDAFANGEFLGHLTIGSGSVIWTGRHKRSSKRIPWSRFADVMDRIAYGD